MHTPDSDIDAVLREDAAAPFHCPTIKEQLDSAPVERRSLPTAIDYRAQAEVFRKHFCLPEAIQYSEVFNEFVLARHSKDNLYLQSVKQTMNIRWQGWRAACVTEALKCSTP